MPDAPTHLIVGRVRRAHGIRGDLVVEPLTDAPDAIFAPGRRVFGGDRAGELGDGVALEIARATSFKSDRLILHFVGIDDRTAADAWRERYLFVPADEVVPPGESEAFLHELPGMHVVLDDGTPVGEVLDYYELPQGVMVEVEWKGARAAIPLIDAFVRDLDRDARRIVMQLPDGLLE
ncbi:MAG TPA: ribosome maturation factor RimM [Gemmatimonadaceae bacterium]|nr:ribosome maturation factor RimM [Gemmatimonadaceae bacterium]